MIELHEGDCLEVMKGMDDNSVHSIVTDPPYGLKFMQAKWDYDVPSVEIWKEALRVLKPGGTALIFAGSRTQHRMAVNVEDAGFILKDTIMYLYGSGFPKSTDISKKLDLMAGVEREIVGKNPHHRPSHLTSNNKWRQKEEREASPITNPNITVPATEAAKQWDGWGTNLKPAYEPILCVQKPLTDQKIDPMLEEINKSIGDLIWLSIVSAEKMDTSRLQETVSINLNTVSLWKAILTELSTKESTFTISTESRVITELRTLKLLISGTISANFTQSKELKADGWRLIANIVGENFQEEKKSMKDIQNVIAQEVATYKQNETGMNAWGAGKDLLPIILTVNTVLLNVLEKLITIKGKEESLSFVNIAEKKLKQYHQDNQNIATQNAWQKITPNIEPIIVAMKPNDGTYANNALKHGVAGLNIDGARIESTDDQLAKKYDSVKNCGSRDNEIYGKDSRKRKSKPHNQGRFPANIIHDGSEQVLKLFPNTQKSKGNYVRKTGEKQFLGTMGDGNTNRPDGLCDSGSAARFFYTAKASKRERGEGCTHPTVKPLSLMQYLCKLVKTPTGGITLDPFMGSGTTGIACKNIGTDFIGIEKDPDYYKIAEARINSDVKEIPETYEEEQSEETMQMSF